MSDKDSVWKEAIETYFYDFVSFFFAWIVEDIDFAKGYDFLDKEFQRIVHEARIGKRYADVLVKVYLKSGLETWLLIHVEVQGYVEEKFEERMFIYNYRIFDRYKKEVISLAILTDTSPDFRPGRYEVSRWRFRHYFEFPIIKLIDYKEKWDELESSRNPFAVIVAAHLKEMETKGNVDSRLFWKVSLVKRLYVMGYTRRDILLLYKFIDWLISLPPGENKKFHEEITKYEEVEKMPYITTAERIGMEKGMEKGELKKAQEAVIEVLETRFETIPRSMVQEIKGIEEVEILSLLHKKAVLTKDLVEFEQILKKIYG